MTTSGLNSLSISEAISWKFLRFLLWLTNAAGVAWEKGTVLTMPMEAFPCLRYISAMVVRRPPSGSPVRQEILPSSVLKPVARTVAAEAESVPGYFGRPGVPSFSLVP